MVQIRSRLCFERDRIRQMLVAETAVSLLVGRKNSTPKMRAEQERKALMHHQLCKVERELEQLRFYGSPSGGEQFFYPQWANNSMAARMEEMSVADSESWPDYPFDLTIAECGCTLYEVGETEGEEISSGPSQGVVERTPRILEIVDPAEAEKAKDGGFEEGKKGEEAKVSLAQHHTFSSRAHRSKNLKLTEKLIDEPVFQIQPAPVSVTSAVSAALLLILHDPNVSLCFSVRAQTGPAASVGAPSPCRAPPRRPDGSLRQFLSLGLSYVQ